MKLSPMKLSSMKLYSLPHSPYATRVRMQARLDNLPVEVLPPPVPLRTEAFYERFPLGKLPVLELESGEAIAESWAIMEFLAESPVSGGSALLPESPLERAQMRMLARYADLHLAVNALFPLFRAVMSGGDVDRDEMAKGLHAELAKGERLMADFGSERALNLGDLALAPTMRYLEELSPLVGVDAPLAAFPALSAWWQKVNAVDAISETLQEMALAYRKFAEGLAAKA
ncbi:glutathione S-transferase family protein [Microbulbifer agarilyticus]|uniref:glutathione S-transferase family protein n=1 Tax=Microbulbifer agarilyticus TaxID=260552 RepID=UPI001C974BCB|nr:glutathione S-transferase family protein [Microbulbifer agarilyticus]MBY6210855.1 glutathione S-transferase family protein [Microbulbifer agarilyticus]